MPCSCTSGLCSTCSCGKNGVLCGPACHGGHGISGNCVCMNFAEALKTQKLPISEVRKALAGSGLDCIGTANELKRRLAEHLLSTAVGGGSVASDAPTSNNSALFRSIDSCSGDYLKLLSLSGMELTMQSSVSAFKKAYLKLALTVHPDKNRGSSESKVAFQQLVSALERLSQPGGAVCSPPSPSQGPRKKVATAVERSNDGCVQHTILCPRCGMDWPRKELGLEDGAYNFFMGALKEYTCGRCACLFGCMTATHICPGCKKSFSYSPDQYHTRMGCGNGGCTRVFGFVQYSVSEKRLKEVRKSLVEAQEERLIRAEAKQRRDARSSQRLETTVSGMKGEGDSEKLFIMELVDVCPRCGEVVLEEGSDVRIAHLKGCVDKAVHAVYAKRLAERQQSLSLKDEKAARSSDTMALASWVAGGRVVGTLWTLPRGALTTLCRDAGLLCRDEDSRVDLVRRFSTHCRTAAKGEVLLLEDSPTGTSGSSITASKSSALTDTAGIAVLEDYELPKNFHSLTAEQLASVCAALGLPGEEKDGKSTLIKNLTSARYKGREEEVGMLTLEGGGSKRGRIKYEREEKEEEEAYVDE